MKLTKTQKAALIEAAGPKKYVFGLSYGGGTMRVDPRVIRALRTLGLVDASAWDVREGKGYLTDAGREVGQKLLAVPAPEKQKSAQ